MKTAEIRRAFLEFFKEKDHAVVQSSSLVPHNDPTLLFTNAGMVQFKEVFLGRESRPYSRATSSQKCIRAGGKHNDLENVGYTARHHTFFEMLGNFSFGDYFKREAIQFAWSFLTEHLKIPKSKLWITVFQEDEETAKIWLDEIKVDPNRFSRCGEKDNFWSMGDTGPCGPCTEIYYDHGASVAGGPPGSKDEDGDRFIEIWNIVFMQFDRREDGTLLPLPKPSVDTGMGMERVAAVMQGVHSNYEIDLFQDLIRFIAALANTSSLENKSLRVIADHIRACAFLAAEGVIPSNEGRGYVFRRICRRAIRHGHKLGLGSPFFYKLVQPLIEAMGEAYPELKQQKAQIERVLEQEELQFARTLDQGMKILEQDLALVADNTIPGNTLFRLYDTYGFPVDLTADIARERGLKVDMDGFNEAMARQRMRGREASQFQAEVSDRVEISQTTDFTGYETLEEESIVEALFKDGIPVNQLSSGESGFIILDHTPFYAESGGQVGDQGMLEWKDGKFRVDNTKKSQAAHLHYGEVILGALQKETLVQAKVDQQKRQRTALNHSATHLLHAALRKLLGAHVQQKGSLVEPDRLRFDFTHMKPMTEDEKRSVERLVNAQIRANTPVQTDVMAADKALESGAMALFGEKYGDQVRVLRMGEEDFSVELCGGTHVGRTGDIGLLKIVSETGIAAGVRRIEALTGEGAEQYLERIQDQLMMASNTLKCSPDVLDEKLGQLLTRGKQLEKENQALKVQQLSKGSESLETKFKPQDIDGHKVLVAEVEGGDPKSLREMVDRLKNQYKSGVFALISVIDEKVILTIGVTRDCIDKGLDAGELAKIAARWVGGQGGGRPDLAQAGGNNPAGIPEILKGIPALVLERIRPKRVETF